MAYPINGKWRKVEILEIEQDHKQQDKVANGNVGIKVKERLPECVLYYMKNKEWKRRFIGLYISIRIVIKYNKYARNII